ncbi:YkgJ family cysteine cluster protein [Helicobacter saguini]|nr:YkgJ family cysteine cluster protein [Helicobacter saguini]
MISKEGFDFEFDENMCEKCGGKCCYGESGYIFVSVDEMKKVAEFLKMPFEDLTLRFVKKVGYRFSFIEQKCNILPTQNLKDRILKRMETKNISSQDSIESKKEDSKKLLDFKNQDSKIMESKAKMPTHRPNIADGSDMRCVFFNEKSLKCDIYPVRPKQCRTFPFWEMYKKDKSELIERCIGICNIKDSKKI